MKKTVYTLTMLLLVTLGFQSCEDLEVVDAPNFEVAFNATAKVGEPVEFTVNNAPNFLYFYAGDFEHQYKYRDRTNADGTVIWRICPNFGHGALSCRRAAMTLA